jgi:hypothetical protein
LRKDEGEAMNCLLTRNFRGALAVFLTAGIVPAMAQEKANDKAPEKPLTPYLQMMQRAANVPLLLLNTEDKVWQLHVTSGSQLRVKKGNVMVNSSNRGALWTAGDDTSIQVDKGAIGVVGSVTKLGQPIIQPAPKIGFKPMADPFPAFNVPQDVRVVSGKKLFLNNEGEVTLSPGIYEDGIFATGKDSTLHLQPGTYIIRGGDFHVSGAALEGKDVTIVMMPGARGAGNFSTVFGAKVNLSAPTSGDLQGLAILSAGKWPNSISFQATQGVINGTIYAPQVELKVSGESNVKVTRAMVSNLSIVLKGVLEITGADMPDEAPPAAAEK